MKDSIKYKSNLLSYSYNHISKLFKYMLIFFITNYSKIHKVNSIDISQITNDKDYKKFKEDNYADDIDKEDFDVKYINKLSDQNLLKIINDMSFEYIYDFINEVILQVKNTYFGKKIFNKSNNEIKLNNSCILFQDENKYPVLFKNLYNFGKSLYHNNYNQDNNIFYDWDTKFDFYQSMDKQNKINLIERKLLNVNELWFSLNNNYKYIYPNESNYKKYIKDISVQIENNLFETVFENLIFKGILSEFIPEKELTDDRIIPSTYFT